MKTKSMLMIIMSLFIMISCNEDVQNDVFVSNKQKNRLTIEVYDEFNTSSTRANYSGFPSTIFETGDAIGVYVFDGSSYVMSNIRFVKQSDGSWLPDEDVPYNESNTYYAYFPYSENVYTPSTSGSIDAIDTKFASFISDASNYFWQANQSTENGFTYSNLMIAKGTVTDVDDDTVTLKFTMSHKRGLALFTGYASTAEFSGDNIPYSDGDIVQFLMKPSTVTSFTDESGTVNLSARAGTYARHWVNQGSIDLSMVDNAGNERASRTTANCYMVHAAGKYKIPLVYGNAIKNGETNERAYRTESGVNNNTDVTIGVFVNHDNRPISDPWLKNNGITPTNAYLIWQDVDELITEVGIQGDYLTFKIGTYTPGNAVIGVGSSSTNIYWSWHIWVTDETYSNLTTVSTGSHDYNVTHVNLGWIPTSENGKQGYNTYYQWGRKDPFPGENNYSGTAKTLYDLAGNTVTITMSSSTGTTYSIKEPKVALYNSNWGNAMSTYYNLWHMTYTGGTTAFNIAGPTVKTIYDPCPPGFCVPTDNLFYYMANGSSRTMATWDSTDKGCTWNTDITGDPLWFPATGAGWVGSSGYTPQSYNGTQGNYTHAIAHKYSGWYVQQKVYLLYARSANWNFSRYDCYNAGSVRPVAEE